MFPAGIFRLQRKDAGKQSKANVTVGRPAVDVEILRVHLRKDFVLKGDYVDPKRWQPLIYNFRHYCGLGTELGKTFRAEI